MQKFRYRYEECAGATNEAGTALAGGSAFLFRATAPASQATFGLNARLDFLAPDIYRVAMWRDGARLIPTWAVAPGDTPMPREGRDRLSLAGFSLYVPAVTRRTNTASDGSVIPYDSMGNHTRVVFSLPGADVVLSLPCFALEVRTKTTGGACGGTRLFADRAYSPYNYAGELGEGSAHFVTAERGSRYAESGVVPPETGGSGAENAAFCTEEIFGVGEKSGNVNRFGRRFEISARDAMGYDASSSDPLYKHLPFYLCRNSAGSYGIFYDTHAHGSLNFMQEMDNYYGHFKSFTSDDDVLVYYVFLGSVRTIARNFAWLCGRSVFSPKWSLDYNGSTMTYTDAPDADAQLRGFLTKCCEHDLRCSGFYLSSGYTSIGAKRYVFNWNTEKIPNPRDLVSTFRKAGVHLIPNIKPAFLEDHPLYNQIAENGWFLHYADGTPAKMPFWDGYGSYLDFTNPDAFDFWTRMAKERLVDYGMDALWNDNNEYYIADRDVWAAGFGEPIPAYRICQVFPMLMVMASAAALSERNLPPFPEPVEGRGEFVEPCGGRPRKSVRHFMSTRSGGAGINRLAQTWTGDNYTSFRDLRFNHKMILNMSLSAMPLVGHDLGGFAGPPPSRELFLRWLQYGVLLPRFCIHSWNDGGKPTEPWMYPDAIPAVRKLFELRHRIKPFLYQLLYRVHANFDTFVTPVFVDFPAYDVESDAFLLGHDLLAVCVFTEGADTVPLTLPAAPPADSAPTDACSLSLSKGTAFVDSAALGWYADVSLDEMERYYEPGDYTFPCTLSGQDARPVLLHRAGSVFVEDASPYSVAPDTSASAGTSTAAGGEQLLCRVYALKAGTFRTELYADDGLTADTANGTLYHIEVECADSSVTVRGVPAEWSVHLVDHWHRPLKRD